jgi:hypothetical protein
MPVTKKDETTTPLFPCVSLKETLDFYRTLGFGVTYEQESPYAYGAVSRGGIDLHFHGTKQVNPEKSFSTCLVFVLKVGPYHRAFADALRVKYGKVPTAGLPRITRLQKDQTRFTTFDPSGNKLVFIDRDEPEMDYSWYEAKRSNLGRAIDMAVFLRDTYYEDKAAAKVLDKALATAESADPIERALALAARAELAVAMGDAMGAQAAQAELQQVPLSEADRARLCDELQAAERLERWLTQPAKKRGRES